MRTFLLNFFCFLLLTVTYLVQPNRVFAQDFRSDYQVEYFLSETENRLNTKVKFTVSITNFRTDVYVKQFSIGFPKSFTIRDIKASDDHGSLKPEIDINNSVTKITLDFSNPSIGKNSKGNFYLEFNQEKLFNVNGNVWEVIIPTVENKQNGSYVISVQLPQNSDKKISIAKPKPNSISETTITWTNPTTKTIYAVFGETQHYQTDLTYHLKNDKLIPVYTDIAFPPDTLYQKIFVNNINPTPAKVFTDKDGNYLGRYFLNPKEAKTVLFNGTVSVFSKPREDIIPQIRNSFTLQKNYLLAETKYWKVTDKKLLTDIQSEAKNIYDFVTKNLSYDYNKIASENKRLGGDGVLKKPANAVCMEFTDLFIAIARDKKIYAREIEGYGFSQDPKLRPISLVSDILHSWPEYYDTQSQLWIPIDPTWEDTSGIDYFSSFDLNHITFVIHGEDPEYPLPAGTYKIEESRDVSIAASNKIPEEIESLLIEHSPFPTKINDNQTYNVRFQLTNTGNVFLWTKPLVIENSNIEVSPTTIDLSSMAPFEKKEVMFSFKAKEKNKKTQGDFKIEFPQNKIMQAQFAIVPFYLEISILMTLVISLVAGTAFLIILVRKTRKL